MGATVVAASVTVVQGIVGHVEQSVGVLFVTLGQEQSVFCVAMVTGASVATVSGASVATVTGACVVQSAVSSIGSSILILPFFICNEKLHHWDLCH